MRDDAVEVEMTLALLSQALTFLSRVAFDHNDRIADLGAVLELIARVTDDMSAPGAMRLTTALNALEPVCQEDTK